MIRTMTMGLGAVAILLCAGGSASAQKQLRIGVVNMERAVRETEEGRIAENNLIKKKKRLEDELNRKVKELQDKDSDLAKASSILKDNEKKKRLADLQKEMVALQKRAMDAERELMEEKTKVMMKISTRINKVIQGLAEREKYDFIFNNAGLLWAPRHTDMTNEVIRALNRK